MSSINGNVNKNLNLLFLDIDGVLNYLPHSPANSYNGRFRCGEEIEPELVKKLNKICNEIPNLKIIISSSWRGNMKRLIWALRFAGFEYVEDIIGKTPHAIAVTEKIYKNQVTKLEPPFTLLYERRGQQILKWFTLNPGITQRINKFAILDDECYDITGEVGCNFFKDHMFQTQSDLGLSNMDVQDIINYFKETE